jgi:hypothetical protein
VYALRVLARIFFGEQGFSSRGETSGERELLKDVKWGERCIHAVQFWIEF